MMVIFTRDDDGDGKYRCCYHILPSFFFRIHFFVVFFVYVYLSLLFFILFSCIFLFSYRTVYSSLARLCLQRTNRHHGGESQPGTEDSGCRPLERSCAGHRTIRTLMCCFSF